MATDMLQYLDPDGLDETVLNIGQIKTSLEGQISDLGESIEEEMQNLPYARPDGLYPDMTVGAVIGADETAQWAQRVSTGSGAATVRSVQGEAVKFNQYANFGERTKEVASDATWTTLPWSSGFASVLVDGHVYYASFEGKGTVHTIRLGLNTGNSNSNSVCLISNPTLEYARASGVITFNAAPAGNGLLISNSPTHLQDVAGDYFAVRNIMLIDLTLMFGSGNEPSTAAEFEAMYPASYYPYSAPTLKPVRIAGIESTDANGDALDSVEWDISAYFPDGMWGWNGGESYGYKCDKLYSDHAEIATASLTEFANNTWTYVEASDMMYATQFNVDAELGREVFTDIPCAAAYFVSGSAGKILRIFGTGYADGTAFKASLTGKNIRYALETPTTTPISPALPMTYRVQQGGAESIIVPEGEVSAAPVLTVAEPVNAGDEFARIWEAIQSLGYTRNAAQLSRPISLTDVGSVDEVQKETTDVADIETTKEVQE